MYHKGYKHGKNKHTFDKTDVRGAVLGTEGILLWLFYFLHSSRWYRK